MKHLFHSKENITNYNSLSNHLVEISKYLTTNINKMKNCQNSFKFPFVASEILSNTHDKIEKKLFLIKENEKPLILKIIETLNEDNIKDTTIPGYIAKIFTAHISNNYIFNCMYPYLKELFSFLFENIECDSFRDIAFELINKGLNTKHKEKFLELFDIFLTRLKEPNPDKYQFENSIWLIIALCRINEDIYHKIDEILSVIFSIFYEKNEQDNNIYSREEFDKFTLLMQLITNILYIALKNRNTEIFSYNLCITNLIDTNLSLSENYDLSNIDLLTDFDGSNIDIFRFICKNFNLLYSIFLKCKKYLQEQKVSSSTFFLSNLLDTLIILLNFNPKFPIITTKLSLDLLNLMKEYPNNSIIHQKISGIFSIFEKENFDSSIIINDLEQQILTKSNIEEVLVRNKIISNKSQISNYLIYFIKIYSSLKEKKNEIDDLIQKYNEIISKGLFQNELTNNNEEIQHLEKDEQNN